MKFRKNIPKCFDGTWEFCFWQLLLPRHYPNTHLYILFSSLFLKLPPGTYYPAVSVYKAGQVAANFGPTFATPIADLDLAEATALYAAKSVRDGYAHQATWDGALGKVTVLPPGYKAPF